MVRGLCGIVVLYHPGKEVLLNVLSYANSLEKLWIVDNTEAEYINEDFSFSEHSNVELIRDGSNLGIGKRINFAIEQAISEGFYWLLTMDQDSSFTNANLTACLTILSGIGSKEDIALVGVNHDYAERDPDGRRTMRAVNTIITSGTWINLRAAKDIGLMNEDLFIDEVDSDYSYRSIIKGWRVLICDGVYLKHNLGDRKLVRSFKTGEITNRGLHSSLRLYYITRNFLWVRKRYRKQLPGVFKNRIKEIINIYKNNLLYNSNKIEMVKMIRKGYLDYRRNKLGKLIV